MKSEEWIVRKSIICALGSNRAIGRKNRLLWHISGDLRRFKRITTGHSIIMGRKTYESIGRPLPARTNIILTRNRKYKAAGCEVVHSVDDALAVAGNSAGAEEVFIIGGGEIYRQFMDITDRLYLTLVDDEPDDADTFFSDYSDFTEVIEEEPGESNGLHYKYVVIERKKQIS